MFLLLLIAAGIALYVYMKWNFSYWKRQGFPYEEPKIPFGTLDSVRTRERSLGMAIYDTYRSSKDKFLGIYLLLRPALLVRDAELARDILTKDFTSFHDRGIYVNEEKDPMSGNLFALQGKKWKTLRTKLAPSFTSGKLKGMFGTIDDISNKMLKYLTAKIPEEGSVEIEMKSVFATYAIDIIGSVIFGLEINSFENPANEFYRVSSKLNEKSFASVLRGTVQFLYPTLEKIFIFLGWTEVAPECMKNIVRETITFREKNNVSRRDMLQLLLQLRNTGKISADDNVWDVESVAESFKSMSIESIASQMLLFYVAGFETSASSAAFTLYELSQYPELLVKAQRDVENALERHDGKLTYEAIQDMKFLDLCVMETIRKYPGLPILNRECTQDFSIPNSDLIIKKGTPIIISLFGMQRDPEYFPNPMGYEPERFLEENMNYNPAAYMPFGEGPRHCIAQRMGKVNVKVALAGVLTNFNVETRKERKEIEIDNYGIPIMPKGGVNISLSKKKQHVA